MDTISVRQLALRLGTDPRTVRGIAIGLRVNVVRTPAADLISTRDAKRIETAYHARQVLSA